MNERFATKAWWMLGLGFAMGLVFGVGILVGSQWTQNSSKLELPETLLHATATHGSDSMAIATGPIDEGTEGFFVLDFLTGQLQCSVLNPRTGQLAGLYMHNVVKDLGVEQGKQPKYLMVTGAANFRYGGGSVRPAESVVYVADANTGHYVAYMLPWNRNAAQYNAGQVNPMVPLGKGTARNIEIE
jgi:hypothetical protein